MEPSSPDNPQAATYITECTCVPVALIAAVVGAVVAGEPCFSCFRQTVRPHKYRLQLPIPIKRDTTKLWQMQKLALRNEG
jgi:hypothetical protein